MYFYQWTQKGKGRNYNTSLKDLLLYTAYLAHIMSLSRTPPPIFAARMLLHMDSLKLAFVREPSPMPYFIDKVVHIETPIPEPPQSNFDVTQETGPSQESPLPNKVVSKEAGSSQDSASLPTPIWRPKRSIRKPLRFRNSDHTAGDVVSSDSSSQFNIKRIIGQRLVGDNTQYKVTLRGEPSD